MEGSRRVDRGVSRVGGGALSLGGLGTDLSLFTSICHKFAREGEATPLHMPYWSSSRVGAVPQPNPKPKKRNERYSRKKGITMEVRCRRMLAIFAVFFSRPLKDILPSLNTVSTYKMINLATENCHRCDENGLSGIHLRFHARIFAELGSCCMQPTI